MRGSTLSDTPGSREEVRGGTIDQNNKGSRGDTAHNPVDKLKGSTNLNQYETDKGPVNPVKGFDQVKFEDKGTEMFGLDGVERFLYNANGINNLTILEKSELLLRNANIQEGFNSGRYEF